MALELFARKVGMTQIFSDSGECIPVTVLEMGPNTVIQKKEADKHGYSALQLGFGERRPSRTPRGLAGHCQKAKVPIARHLGESRIEPEATAGYEVGQQLGPELFTPGERVDVIGTSKGRGTAGVVKRHGFAVKRRTHGTHEFFRHGGSIGAGAFPGRVIKGQKMAGRMGNERVTALNLEVVRVEPEQRLLFLRGAVPGHRNGVVRVRTTVKGRPARS